VTKIDLANPANAAGTLDVAELWYAVDSGANVVVGTFYGAGTSWTSRDSATVGAVAAGSKQTFSGLSIAVELNDCLGEYETGGTIERDTSGGAGVLTKSGNQFGAGAQTYASNANWAISIYGTGIESGGTAFERSFSVAMGLSPALSRTTTYGRSMPVATGLNASLSRTAAYGRSMPVGMGLAATLSRAATYGRSLTTAVGMTAALSQVVGFVRSLSVAIGLTAALSRVSGYGRSLTANMGMRWKILESLVRFLDS